MKYGYDILLPLMIDEPIAQKAEKNVFYVIRRGYKNRYLSAAPYSPYRETLEEAQRFESVNAALGRIKTMGGVENSTEIVRVEVITTPGKSTRVEVPLGDKRQTGVAIKADQLSPCYANITRKVEGGWMWSNILDDAQVFPTVSRLLWAVAEGSRKEERVASTISGNIVGIADITPPSTTTYTETVLA